MGKNKERIVQFVETELRRRQVPLPADWSTPLISSGKLDSLFLVDLVLFFETELGYEGPLLQNIKSSQVDSMQKLLTFSETIGCD